MANNKLVIFDTTLRDGEQSPGASMTGSEKLRIAKVLEKLNVDIIEAGFPIASKGDAEAVKNIAKTIKNSTICGLARAINKDIDVAGESLKPANSARIHTFIATSEIHMQKKLNMSKEEVTDLLPTSHSDAEYEWSAIIANKFVENLPEFGEVVSFQNEKQIPGDKYGLKYDVVGKTDFEFKDVIVDTKATAYIRRLKAGHVDPKWYPKAADVRQQCLYRDLFEKETALLYCSPKDVHMVDMVDRDHLKDLIDLSLIHISEPTRPY